MEYSTDWDTLIKNYSSYLRFERNLSPNTIESYLRDVVQFREYIDLGYTLMVPEIESSHVEGYMAHLYDRNIGATSQARKLSGLKSFFNFLITSEVIDKSPTEFLESPKTGRKLPDVLSVEEIDKILSGIDLSSAQGHRNKAMLETLYSCGLRVSELINLKLSDLFFDDGYIRVVGKGNKQRLVPLSDVAGHQIRIYLEQRRTMHPDAKNSDIVFLNRNSRKMTRVMVFTIIRRAVECAGIKKSVSPHTFRHSFATHLLQGGASIRQVQEMLGHESILTTEIYTHLDRSHLRAAVNKHHPLG